MAITKNTIRHVAFFVFLVGTLCATTFLEQGIGVPAKQMGGAYTANPEDVTAVFWNMAAFSGNKSEVYVDGSTSFLDINSYTFLYGLSERNDSLILGTYIVDGGDVVVLATANATPENKRFSDTAYFIGYATMLAENSSLGLTIKLIKQNFITQKSSNVLDLSYYKKESAEMSWGLVLENLFASDSEDKLIIRSGARYRVNKKLDLSLDAKYFTENNDLYLYGGVSFRVIYGFYVKAGYNDYDKKLFLGSSLDLSLLKLDYVYYDSDLGATHQIGVNFKFW